MAIENSFALMYEINTDVSVIVVEMSHMTGWEILCDILQKKDNIFCHYFNRLTSPYNWFNHFHTSSISPSSFYAIISVSI